MEHAATTPPRHTPLPSFDQLAAAVLDDQKRFMKQDEFVLHASEGDIKSVQKGLAEKRLCSVKGTHQEKVT